MVEQAGKRTAKNASKARKAAVPQDRKPPRPTGGGVKPPPGAELLRPVAEIPIWDQDRLLELLGEFSESADKDGNIVVSDAAGMRVVAKLAQELAAFAYDADAWTRFCSGRPTDSIPRVGEVVQWYVGSELGNSEPSET
jgi:hypothetical protein